MGSDGNVHMCLFWVSAGWTSLGRNRSRLAAQGAKDGRTRRIRALEAKGRVAAQEANGLGRTRRVAAQEAKGLGGTRRVAAQEAKGLGRTRRVAAQEAKAGRARRDLARGTNFMRGSARPTTNQTATEAGSAGAGPMSRPGRRARPRWMIRRWRGRVGTLAESPARRTTRRLRMYCTELSVIQ